MIVEVVAVFLLLGACCICGAGVVAQLAPWLRPVWRVYGPFVVSVCGALVDCVRAWLEQLSAKDTRQAAAVVPAANDDDDDDDDDAARCGVAARNASADDEPLHASPSKGLFSSRRGGGSFCRLSTADDEDADGDWEAEPEAVRTVAVAPKPSREEVADWDPGVPHAVVRADCQDSDSDSDVLPCNALTISVSGTGNVRAARGAGFDMYEGWRKRQERMVASSTLTFGGRGAKDRVVEQPGDINAAWRAQKLAAKPAQPRGGMAAGAAPAGAAASTRAACTFGGRQTAKPKKVSRSRRGDPDDLS